MRRRRLLALSISVSSLIILALVGSVHNTLFAQTETVKSEFADRDLLGASGTITMLRVHDVGTGFGPGSDFIDGEVVIRLDTEEGRAFGFQLRNDDNRPAREAMLGLLRDAFNHDWIVTINYWLEPGKTNGEMIRVWITKPLPIIL